MFELDCKGFGEQASIFLNTKLNDADKQKVVIGVSGGVDSAVILKLVTKALGKEHVIPVLLHKSISDKSYVLAQDLITNGSLTQFSTSPIYNLIENFKDYICDYDSFRIGNISARIRMILLFDIAKANNALVLGTENKSEKLLGYYTRHGDSASDVELITTLYKTQVYKLAKYLSVSKEIIDVKPSAELWNGQTDEDELGLPYEIIDKCLYGIENSSVTTMLATEIITLDQIEEVRALVAKNKFKEELPYLFNYKGYGDN